MAPCGAAVSFAECTEIRKLENTFLVCFVLLRIHRGVSAPSPQRNVHRTVRMRHGVVGEIRRRTTVLQIAQALSSALAPGVNIKVRGA